MFATLATVTLFAAAAINGVAAELSIATPQLTTCEDAQITWSATTGLYNLIIVPASDPCADALVDLGDISGTSTTWTPNLAPGTAVELSLVDSNGEEAWSGAITITQGSSTSCVSPDLLAAASSSAAAAASSAVSSAASTAVAGTTLVVTGTAASSASSSAASSGVPVGAVGNSSPLGASKNGASREATSALMILGAFTAVLAFSL